MKGLLFTYALTYGGAAASLFNPFIGLLIYVCFSIIRPESLWHWSVPAGNYSRIVAIGLLLGWALQGFGNWNLGRSRGILLSLLGFLGWMALAAAAAPEQTIAWGRVEAFAKTVLPFVVGLTTINTLAQLQTLGWVITASAGYLAIEMNQNYLAGFIIPTEFTFAHMDNNGIALMMASATGLAFFLGLYETRPWRRWLAFGLAGAMAHVVMFSDSRGGMLALVVCCAVTFLIIRKRPSHYLYFALALAIAARLAGPPVIERFSTVFAAPEDRDASGAGRLQLSATCLQMMKDSPLFGVGPGGFQLVSHNYGWPLGKDGHTTWLQAGAEMGVPAMICLLGVYLLTIKNAWLLSRVQAPELAPLADVARMSVASLAGFMVGAQFITAYGEDMSYYIALLGAGAVKLSFTQIAEAGVADSPEDAQSESDISDCTVAPALHLA